MPDVFMPAASLPTQEIPVTTSSVAHPIALTPSHSGSFTLRIEGDAATKVFIREGGAAATVTTTTGRGILPGSVETIRFGTASTHLAVIAAAGATLRVTPGEGI